MKRNGMCPVCFLKQLFTKTQSVTDLYTAKPYPATITAPPMGWSSWNTFKNKINEKLIYEQAVAMKEKGLAEAGYTYINLDDNWHSSLRDEYGKLQGDLATFAGGIPALVKKINALGLKVGIYSSNGTETCEDLPASLYHEQTDADTFAEWGIEYFKYDFCHNIKISQYAPLLYGISVAKKGSFEETFYPASAAKLEGLARFMPVSGKPFDQYIGGLDRNSGACTFDVEVPEGGEYVLTLNVFKKGRYSKCAMAIINGADEYWIETPSQKKWNDTARFQMVVTLSAGKNSVKIFNPIKVRADSAMLQYRKMGQCLIKAAEKVAKANNTEPKYITFSLCEWGVNSPYKWGATAGNLWRTTPDIRPIWKWMMFIYSRNVIRYKYSSVGHYNDPDMLEVGNGKLTYDENYAHFATWCMMAAPLILGNDLRTMPDNVLKIITDKKLIAIDQDPLGKAAKRVKKGSADVLARPLSDGTVAVCFFNKAGGKKRLSIDFSALVNDEYVQLPKASEYAVTDVTDGTEFASSDGIACTVRKHAAKVYIVKAK